MYAPAFALAAHTATAWHAPLRADRALRYGVASQRANLLGGPKGVKQRPPARAVVARTGAAAPKLCGFQTGRTPGNAIQYRLLSP